MSEDNPKLMLLIQPG